MDTSKSSAAFNPALIISVALIIALSTFVWIWPTLQIPEYDAANPHTLYLLSTIAQAIAAIAGIVFVASLIVGQISANQMDAASAKAIDRLCAEFLLLLVSAILLSLWLLSTPSARAIKIAFTFAAAALIMLLPFLLALKEKLNVLKQTQKMAGQCLKLVKEADGVPAELAMIDNAAVRAYVRKDYQCFEVAVKALGEVFLAAHESGKAEARNSSLERLTEVAILSIDDPRAPIRVIETIENFGQKLTERGSEALVIHVIRALRRVGLRASDSRADRTVGRAISAIDVLIQIASQKGLYDSLSEAVGAAEVLAIRSLHHDDDDLASAAIASVARIEATPPASALKVKRLSKKVHSDVMEQIAEALQRVSASALNSNDPLIAKQAAAVLTAIAKAGAEGGVGAEVAEMAIGGIERFGILSAQHDLKDLVCYSLQAFGEIGLSSAENNRANMVRQIAHSAGAVAAKRLSPESIEIFTKVIGEIGIRADEKGLLETAWAAHVLGTVAARIAELQDQSLNEQFGTALRGIAQAATEKKLTYFTRLIQDASSRLAQPKLEIKQSA